MSDIAGGLPAGQADVVSALVTAPQGSREAPRGTASFYSDGVPISSCQDEILVPNDFNDEPPLYTELSAASCQVDFTATGTFTTFTLTVKVTEVDGATDIGTLGVLVVP